MKDIIIQNIEDIKLVLVFFIVFFVIFLLYLLKREWFEKIYKHRFCVALVVFVLCVVFEISGSSIGIWNIYLNNGEKEDGVIVGESKTIRSDEWAVNTPMAYSQKFNDFGYFSDVIRGTATDVFIVYGQPVKDIGIIYRAFQIGYLLFGTSKGQAIFWCGRFIALFLITFEFMLLITKRKRGISFIGTILVSFAPVIGWWFAINGLVEMIIAGQLAIILLDKYMLSQQYKKRLLYLFGMVISAGTYLLTFYPSWQIPFIYVFAGLALWVLIKNWKNCKINKKDIFTIITFVVLFLISNIYIFTKSLDTIKSVLNTVYPGSRVVTGGGEICKYFSYAINPFFWEKDVIQKVVNGKIIASNVCEEAVFFDLFPIGFITSFIILFKQKYKDKLLIISIIVSIILGTWCILGFPEILAKITLLSNSQASRSIIAVGFLNIVILIRSLALIEKPVKRIISGVLSILIAGIIVFINKIVYLDYIGDIITLSTLVCLSIIFYLILRYNFKYNKYILTFILLIIVLFSGATVNPIRKGVGEVYDSELINRIQEISQNDNRLWIVEGNGLPYNNIPIMAGAKTINSTNVYPILDRWKIFDKNGENEKIYNRYAHITINLTNENKIEFKLTSPDAFTVNLNIDELSKLDVKYILALRDLSGYSNDKKDLKKIYEYNNYEIYEIKEK